MIGLLMNIYFKQTELRQESESWQCWQT